MYLYLQIRNGEPIDYCGFLSMEDAWPHIKTSLKSLISQTRTHANTIPISANEIVRKVSYAKFSSLEEMNAIIKEVEEFRTSSSGNSNTSLHEIKEYPLLNNRD